MLIRDIEIELMSEEEVERFISKKVVKRNLYQMSKKPLSCQNTQLSIYWDYSPNVC